MSSMPESTGRSSGPVRGRRLDGSGASARHSDHPVRRQPAPRQGPRRAGRGVLSSQERWGEILVSHDRTGAHAKAIGETDRWSSASRARSVCWDRNPTKSCRNGIGQRRSSCCPAAPKDCPPCSGRLRPAGRPSLPAVSAASPRSLTWFLAGSSSLKMPAGWPTRSAR